MVLHKLPIVVLVLIVSALTEASTFTQKEAPRDVRGRLLKQVLADFPDVRECIEKEDGGTRAAEENITAEEVDLNRDRVSEYQVQLAGPCVCGMVNCAIYIYRQTPRGYELILDGASGLGLEVLRTSSNGFSDVRVDARDNAATQSQTTYKFDGKQYRERGTRLVIPESGESKPAYRRVQFKRGSTSTTVQGRVSIALPDTYLIGARAGQLMTVKLTSPRTAVRFMVMTSRTTEMLADNTRSWTGSLPETGDYHIIVDGDEKTSTYSMTITIK